MPQHPGRAHADHESCYLSPSSDATAQDPSQLSQLLRQRAGSQFAIHSFSSDDHRSVNATSTFLSEGPPSPLRPAPSQTRAAPRRVRFNSRHATPNLHKYHSAPVSTGEPVTEKKGERKSYHSFNSAMDAPGDTQVDPEIFKVLTSGILGSNSVLGAAFEPKIPPVEDGSSESAQNYVTDSSQEQVHHRITSPVTLNDDNDTQLRTHYAETSPLKFETPAAYPHRKRNSQSQILSSVARTTTTPGTALSASAFFGFGGDEAADGMSLTQAFNATQAKTSPAAGNPTDDVVFQRPSPNFAHPRHSSPSVLLSSPTKPHVRRNPVGDVVLRSSSEPRLDYESMKQSQERRSRERASEEMEIEQQPDSWDDPTDVGKHYARRRAKQRMDQEAAQSLAAVSAPIFTTRQLKKRGLLSTNAIATSPRRTAMTERQSHQGPYDGADGPYELSQPLVSNGYGHHSPDRDHHHRPSAPATTVNHVEAEQGVQVPHTSSHPTHILSELSSRNSSQLEPSPSRSQPQSQNPAATSQPVPKSLSRLRSSRETDVVMDSQPEPAGTAGASQPAPLRYPSSPSSNQYSINQTTMLSKSAFISSPVSSAIPMPPKSSSEALAMTTGNDNPGTAVDDGVPSSPPLITQEEDITYDEHAYEEDSDAERSDREPQADEDVDMAEGAEEDGLLATQDDPDKDAEPGSERETEDDECAQSVQNGDEVPETIDHEHQQAVSIRSSHSEDNASTSMGPPRIVGQSTIPEPDVLEDTQPSLFPVVLDTTHPDSPKAPTVDDTAEVKGNDQVDQSLSNDNEQFDTAKEHQSTSQAVHEINSTVEEAVTTPSPARFKGRSLLDIANQSDTQRSVDLDGLDLPQLSLEGDLDEPLDAMIARDSPFHPQKKRRTTYSTKKAFRSPIKETDPASEQFNSSPQPGVSNVSGWSPPTTQDREAQGARAATRAREAGITQSVALKSKTRFKPNQPQTPRSGALKSVNKALLSKSPGRTPSKLTLGDQAENDRTPTRSSEARNADVEIRNVDIINAEHEQAPSADVPTGEHTLASTAGDFVEDPSGQRDVPNRVFAFWPGIGYCPATCVGRVDSHRLRVRYDDGTINILESLQVRALDLHPTDQIKIDIPGMKKQAYVVVGFKGKVDLEHANIEYPSTNRHGYATIVLEEKQRDSLPAAATACVKKYIDVPVANIYLTAQLWARLKDRTFHYDRAASPAGSASRVGTPRIPESAIPISTSLRRSTGGPSLLRDSTARASSVASSARSSGNVFLDMAFAVTSTSTEVDKDDLSKLIRFNGGLVLDEGFHELFDTESYGAPTSSTGTTTAPSASMHGLKLKRKHEDLRCVVLIAQSHSRSPKFLQALSLNIPCVHLRWVHDSLAVGHPLPFAKYLLPAGTSTFLDPAGVVRSRDMPTYDPTAEDASFAQMVKDRKLLFHDESVLIVSEENEQEPYIFITHAMGATEVGQCSDLEEAKESVDTGAWDWLYVDGKPDALADAAAQLFGAGGKTGRKKAAKKRKRDSEVVKAEPQTLVRTGVVGEKNVKVACGEFVIQSLILGALVEE